MYTSNVELIPKENKDKKRFYGVPVLNCWDHSAFVTPVNPTCVLIPNLDLSFEIFGLVLFWRAHSVQRSGTQMRCMYFQSNWSLNFPPLIFLIFFPSMKRTMFIRSIGLWLCWLGAIFAMWSSGSLAQREPYGGPCLLTKPTPCPSTTRNTAFALLFFGFFFSLSLCSVFSDQTLRADANRADV